MANHRVKVYKVTYEDGESYLEPFSEAQANGFGVIIETDGIAIGAAIRMVEYWNTRARQ